MRHVEPEGRLDNTGKPISEYQNPEDVLDQSRRMARVDIARILPLGMPLRTIIHRNKIAVQESISSINP